MNAAPGRLPVLLAAAARVLEQASPLPPATVTCDPATRVLPPVTLTPASPDVPAAQQRRLVHTVAAEMGWSAWPLDGGDGAIADGTVDGVRVQALAAPLPSALTAPGPGPEEDPARTGTAEHAALLRALTDWAADLPATVTALEVREDPDTGALTGRLVLATHAAADQLPDIVLGVPNDGWSGLRGHGLLPTGHTLTISVGT
ncbi:hypothetical protein [Actinomadura sp. 21ATH]|uniref:hypothetical protein n=1 Tax=Actinomadura sp. 21ATH TaxID=1735444 RepID=UPI0035BF2AB2